MPDHEVISHQESSGEEGGSQGLEAKKTQVKKDVFQYSGDGVQEERRSL